MDINDAVTTIVLPLNKPDWSNEKIAQALQDIEPETILFLKKLQSIDINIEGKKPYQVLIEKDATQYPLVRLVCIKKAGGKEELSEELYWCAEREFDKPVDINPEKRQGISKRSVSVAIPLTEGHKGKLFAYLPVYEETGIPFLINGDFLLASSREGIKTDEPWNKWLRGCVAEVYTEALLSCLNSKSSPFEQRINAYASIPHQTPKTPFLNSIVTEIKNKLKDKNCIFSESGKLTTPISVKRASQDFRSLFLNEGDSSPAHLKNSLQLIHGDIEKFSSQLTFLGVTPSQDVDILSCLDDTSWVSQRSNGWFVRLYTYLMGRKLDSKILRTKSILPVSDGVSCDKGSSIYFRSAVNLNGIPVPVREIVPAGFLNVELQKLIEKSKNSAEIIDWIGKNLNVKELSLENYRKDVVKKVKESSIWRTLSPEALLSITKFMLDGEIVRIGDFPVLLDDKTIKMPDAASKIVVPKSYDMDAGWQHIWRTDEDRREIFVLSNSYDKNAISKMLECRIVKEFPFGADEVIYLYPSIFEEGTKLSKNTAEALLKWVKAAPSLHPTVAERLKTLSWIPVTKGKEKIFCEPPKAFLGKPAIKEVLGNDVPYFKEGDLSLQHVKSLGIKTDIDYETLLETLESYSGDKEAPPKTIEKIYAELEHRTRNHNKGIKQFFEEKNLIFNPKNKSWTNLDGSVWKDCSAVFGDDFVYLESHYPRLKSFFVETLEIKPDADSEVYANRWLILQGNPNVPREQREQVLSSIYNSIYPEIMEKDTKPNWWGKLKSRARIYTESDSFEDAENVLYPDDGEYKEMFNQGNVKYSWKPEGASSKWQSFLEAFGVYPLSDSVVETLERSPSSANPQQPRFLTQSAIQMLASWIREKDSTGYERLKERDVFKNLLFIKEVFTDEAIKVKFSLETPPRTVTISYPIFWDESNNILVIDNTKLDDLKRQIARHLAKRLLPSRNHDLSEWLENIIEAQDTSRLKERGWNVPQELLDNKGTVKKTQVEPILEPPIQDLDDSAEGFKEPFASDCSNPSQVVNDNIQDNEIESSDFEQNEPESTSGQPELNLVDEIQSAFNRDGETELSDAYANHEFYNDGVLRNPAIARERMKENHRESMTSEPSYEKRRKETELSILESLDPATRAYLLHLYAGKCQVCDATFSQRNGEPFFIATHIIERKKARYLDNVANSLCLCPEHFAKWRHGSVESPNIMDEIKNGTLSIPVTMCGEDVFIKYKEKHLADLQELINSFKEVLEIAGSQR